MYSVEVPTSTYNYYIAVPRTKAAVRVKLFPNKLSGLALSHRTVRVQNFEGFRRIKDRDFFFSQTTCYLSAPPPFPPIFLLLRDFLIVEICVIAIAIAIMGGVTVRDVDVSLFPICSLSESFLVGKRRTRKRERDLCWRSWKEEVAAVAGDGEWDRHRPENLRDSRR
jgi:hypothetical protein